MIVPFRTAQIKENVELFIQVQRTTDHLGDAQAWTSEQHVERLRSIAHLMELAKNPFMFKIITDVLPGIGKIATKMTRLDLYDNFVEVHFESEQRRLLKQLSSGKMDKGALSTFMSLRNGEFILLELDFSKQLSHSIFKEHEGINSISYSSILDNGSWKDMLFGPDAQGMLLRGSTQSICREDLQDPRQLIRQRVRLARKRNSYEFSHRSTLEYFCSCLILDPRRNEPSLDLAACLCSSKNAGPILLVK